MQTIAEILQKDWINSLGWMLLHSLWQYAFVATVCALLLFFTKPLSANVRYIIALSSLVMCTTISAVTFYKYQQANEKIIIKPMQDFSAANIFTDNTTFSLVNFINDHVNSLVLTWLFGVFLYSLKIFLDYRYCQHIKNQHIIPTPEKWQHIFAKLAAKADITSIIELRISTIAVVPCVIGHLKPVVLIPMGLLLRMDQQQIELILLHELAHVRRNDYLLGLMQALVKTLLFFNPFLCWISQQVDKEREHACDDIAVTIIQDPLLFATTLKEISNMNIKQQTAMNITGNKLLLTRITRLFSKNRNSAHSKSKFVVAILIIFSCLTITLCVNAEPENKADRIVTIDVEDASVKDVMDLANKKCGTNETVAPAIEEDKITLRFKDIECSKVIDIIKSFPGTQKE